MKPYQRLVVCDPALARRLGAVEVSRSEAEALVDAGRASLPDPECFLMVPPDSTGVFVWWRARAEAKTSG
jgi:hypothetical protein